MKARTIVGILGAASLAFSTPLGLADPSQPIPTPLGPADPRHPIPTPTRNLAWGDVNVLHTTDIHGWALGHSKAVYPERSWSGTFGDFYSFLHHMRAKAKAKNKDLLLVDTGDRRTGSGLTDKVLSRAGVNGQLVSELYLRMGYDAVVPGNHDLKNDDVVAYTIKTLGAQRDGRFLTSNVELRPAENKNASYISGSDERTFLGAPFRRWTTDNGKNILAFGVVPDGAYSKQINVISTAEIVQEEWFKRELRSPVDVFLIIGHVDPDIPDSKGNVNVIYEAIREKRPLTPIMMFGGHTHKRNCKRLQTSGGSWRSMFLQSGNYFNTIGWMSVELDNNNAERDLVMTRRYLDNNVPTFMAHTEIADEAKFHTKQGRNITDYIYGLERAAGLSQVYGYLESDYFLDRKTWSEQEEDPESLFSFYLDAVENILVNKTESPNWMFFSNWGILRGDIYAGLFTLGDMYAISPDDTSPYLSVKVKRSVADAIVETIQNQEKQKKKTRRGVQLIDSQINQYLSNDASQAQFLLREPERPNNLTYGLVTTDECGEKGTTVVGEGDDVRHEKIPRVVLDGSPKVYFWRKSWRDDPTVEADAEVELIFTNYVGTNAVPRALKALVSDPPTPQPYRENVVRQNTMLGKYIRKYFNVIPPNAPLPE